METQDVITGGFSKWPDHTSGGSFLVFIAI